MSSYSKALVKMQKLANQTQIQLQKLTNSANALQAEYNSKEAQAARDWQTQMSKTAHQMEVEDLKKAGLNPVLSSGGAGAQSYTTSSASMVPESGAAALSNLEGAQLGAISNIESTRMSAEATKAAAAQNAAAIRAAAATSAAAEMYKSDKEYKKAMDTTKMKTDTQKWIERNKNASSFAALFDKWTRKAGISGPGLAAVRKALNSGRSKADSLFNNASKYFSNKGKITQSNFKLNGKGVNLVNSALKAMGVKQTAANRKAYVNAFVFRNQSSFNSFCANIYSRNHSHGSHGTPRRGHT